MDSYLDDSQQPISILNHGEQASNCNLTIKFEESEEG